MYYFPTGVWMLISVSGDPEMSQLQPQDTEEGSEIFRNPGQGPTSEIPRLSLSGEGRAAELWQKWPRAVWTFFFSSWGANKTSQASSHGARPLWRAAACISCLSVAGSWGSPKHQVPAFGTSGWNPRPRSACHLWHRAMVLKLWCGGEWPDVLSHTQTPCPIH